MQEWLLPYVLTIWAMGATAGLFLVQILVVDVAGMKARHRPGTPVAVDHSNFLFRATRAHANTNEGIAGFILLALFGVLSAASPTWLNLLAWVYVAARAGHMTCYYANLPTLRSTSFGFGLAALFGMLVVGLLPWLG
ncbi:MAG: MAPEG family protein [Nevskiales bacterium]